MTDKRFSRHSAELVLNFLDRHSLEPNPENYRIGYLYIAKKNPNVCRIIDDITVKGIRVSQKDFDSLGVLTGGEASHEYFQESQDKLRHAVLRFADVTKTSVTDAEAFSGDLVSSKSQVPDDSGIAHVISEMITKTAQMEEKLAETIRETESLRQELSAARDDASRDALTGLFNRRYVEQHIEQIDKNTPVSFAFVDIDHFKAINDKHGHGVGDTVIKRGGKVHPAGDAALCAVAHAMASQLLPGESLARWGGEEFIVVFPGMSAQYAYEAIERARASIESKNYHIRQTKTPLGQITFSAGVASSSDDKNDAIIRADKFLYQAKEQGRNIIVCE